MITLRVHLALALGLAISLRAAEPSPVDALQENALQSAFQILRRDYIRRDELTFQELNRAALQGLLQRLSFSAALAPVNGRPPEAKPRVHAEFVAPGIAYLRPETFGQGEAALFEKELSKVAEQKAAHLILDLRATKAPGSFDEAALMLQCFIPAGEVMFKMKQIGRDDAELFVARDAPRWSGRVVALVDADTNNAAEALAACLRQRKRAIVIGERTRGAAVRFAEVKLDPETLLRYASAEMVLPDGSDIFRKGIAPDLVIAASTEEKRKVYEGSRGASIRPFVTDSVRARYNEAALVGRTNPELDDYVRRSKGQPLPGDDGQTRDVVTQRALDLLRAEDFGAESKLQWPAKK